MKLWPKALLRKIRFHERSDENVPNASSDFEEFEGWARRDSNPLPPASEATGDAAWQFGPARNK